MSPQRDGGGAAAAARLEPYAPDAASPRQPSPCAGRIAPVAPCQGQPGAGQRGEGPDGRACDTRRLLMLDRGACGPHAGTPYTILSAEVGTATPRTWPQGEVTNRRQPAKRSGIASRSDTQGSAYAGPLSCLRGGIFSRPACRRASIVRCGIK